MKLRIRRHRRAFADVTRYYDYIADHNTAAAARFLLACEATFDLLASFPELGMEWQVTSPRLVGIRCRTIRGFRNYVVFYRRLNDDEIEILRVIHAARDFADLNTFIID